MDLQAASLTSILSPIPGPVLTWFSPLPSDPKGLVRERVELSGPVARRWISKTDNFFDSEFPFGASSFATQLPPHWRAPFWITVGWLRGFQLREPRAVEALDLAISDDVELLLSLQADIGPDVLVAQSVESYAFSWPTELPFGLSDGIADVMSFGDEVENPFLANQESVLVSPALEMVPPTLLSNPNLARPRLRDLLTADFIGAGDELAGERVLLTTEENPLATAQLIQLWLHGASAVWVPGGGPDLDEIASTERVTLQASKA